MRWEARTVASARRARERAPGNIQAGLAYRDAGCYRCRRREIRDHIGDAVLAVSGCEVDAVSGSCHRGHGRAGDATERVSYVIDLPFVGAKEKGLVLDNLPGDARAALLQSSLQLCIWHGVEEVPRIKQDAIAAKCKRGAMHASSAALDADVNHRSS